MTLALLIPGVGMGGGAEVVVTHATDGGLDYEVHPTMQYSMSDDVFQQEVIEP